MDGGARAGRTGRAVARRDERANPIIFKNNMVGSVADGAGAQCHMNKAGVCTPRQIKKIEIEK